MKKIFLMLCLVLGASPFAMAQQQEGKPLSAMTTLSDADALYVFGGADQAPASARLSTQEMENTRGGATCRTYVDAVTGEEYEVCRPPYTKQ